MIPWREANRLVIPRSEATWESREGTADLERLSLKWHAPIASVAAVSDRLAGCRFRGTIVDRTRQCSGAPCVKSNMVYSGVRTWYTIHSLAIFR